MKLGSMTPYMSDFKSVVTGTAKPVIDRIKGYGQKLSDAANPTPYNKPSDLGRMLTKPAVVAGSAYVATTLTSDSVNSNFAHAYKCPDESDAWGSHTPADIAKEDYEGRVAGFNDDIESRSGSIEELNKLFIQPDSRTVGDLNQMTSCLYETHHIDPDSVTTFSDKAKDVLSYDMEKLVMTFPELADYATVPEGIGAKLLLMGAAGGVSLTSPYIREKIYKAGLLAKSGISNLMGKLRKPNKS
jgi:hypothetical protein